MTQTDTNRLFCRQSEQDIIRPQPVPSTSNNECTSSLKACGEAKPR
jgi:hypothetical protein